ncbi:hypothetical protein F5Y15DRAFT_141797, partial [Xylariaceae sp. FL0016]
RETTASRIALADIGAFSKAANNTKTANTNHINTYLTLPISATWPSSYLDLSQDYRHPKRRYPDLIHIKSRYLHSSPHYLDTEPQSSPTRSKMPFFYSKHFGNRHVGTSVHASRHGVHKGPWRFSLGKFNCFKA